MPQSVTFTGATLIEFGRSQTGATAKIEFPLTTRVMKAMGWDDLRDFETKASLEGDMAASVAEFLPGEEDKRRAVQLDLQRVHKFVATKQEQEGSRGKGKRWLVQCLLTIRDEAGCQKLEGYILSVPKGDVRISYEKKPVQADIPGTEVDTGCVACNNNIEIDPLNPKKHVSGVKCTAKPVQTEMAN